MIRLCTALLLLLLTATLQAAPQRFATPEAAAEAFVAALGADQADAAALGRLLGDDWQHFIPTEGVQRKDVDAFLALYRTRHSIQRDGKRAHLVVGEEAWTLPLPLVQGSGGWAFDAKAGGAEIRTRRIGRNEDAAIKALQAYHDAQLDYAETDHDGDGVLEYAQRFLSSDGEHDGLYWPDDSADEPSPLGPLFGDAEPGDDFHGYHFRILTAQGASAPGGAYDYLIGDNMTRGFAAVAWPAKYGDSGVMSFMISHEGQVFEKDLGRDGGKAALAMPRFDPDSSWQEVEAPPAP